MRKSVVSAGGSHCRAMLAAFMGCAWATQPTRGPLRAPPWSGNVFDRSHEVGDKLFRTPNSVNPFSLRPS